MHKFVAPNWPFISIAIITTVVVGLLFIYLIGVPIASLFDALTVALSRDARHLHLLVGRNGRFRYGGPLNKTVLLFGGGHITAGNPLPMGVVATAIAVPPIAVGVATVLRRARFSKTENDSGIAVNALLIIVLVRLSKKNDQVGQEESEEVTATGSAVATKTRTDTALITKDIVLLDAEYRSHNEARIP